MDIYNRIRFQEDLKLSPGYAGMDPISVLLSMCLCFPPPHTADITVVAKMASIIPLRLLLHLPHQQKLTLILFIQALVLNTFRQYLTFRRRFNIYCKYSFFPLRQFVFEIHQIGSRLWLSNTCNDPDKTG